MLQQWMITVGILVSYLIALVIFKAAPGSAGTADWRLILGIGAVPALIGLVLRFEMPESPRWLMRARATTRASRPRSAASAPRSRCRTWSSPRRQPEEDDRARAAAAPSWTPGVRRALFVVCVFFIFQQITGINVPLYYGPHLLGPLLPGRQLDGRHDDRRRRGHRDHAPRSTWPRPTSRSAGSTGSGRRKLAIGGYIGMAVSALVAAAGLALMSRDRRGSWSR